MEFEKTAKGTEHVSPSPEIVVTARVKLIDSEETHYLKFSPDKNRLRIGRDSQSDFRLKDINISRFHASLLMRPDGSLLISDTGSSNGTFINGVRLKHGKVEEIKPGETIKFAEIEVRFEWEIPYQITISKHLEIAEEALDLQPEMIETAPLTPVDLYKTQKIEIPAEFTEQNLQTKTKEAIAEIDEAKKEPPAEKETEKSEEKVAEKPSSVARSAGIVSIAVMGSRVMGLVREQVFAYFFGAGFLYDAYQVAFRIPNTLRDLFAEGALSAAFVKTFTDYQINKSEAEAWRLASLVLNALIVILSVITILAILFAPLLVSIIAPGFPAEKAALTTTMTQIMFPFILLVAMAALAMGVLNTKGRFGIPASASTAFNIVNIVVGIALAYWLSGGGWEKTDKTTVPGDAAQWAIIGMAIGTLIGGAAQFLIQVPSLWKVGFRFSPVFNFKDEGLRKVAWLMAPAIIGTSAVQIKVLVDSMMVSGIQGGQSWLSYAFRLMQFPIGVFGVAIGTAAIPALSRLAAQKDIDGFRKTLSSSMSLVFLLTVPSACGLVVLSSPIIRLLYERGRFNAEDTQMVAWALLGYSIGLTGYAAIKVLSPAFYALDDVKTPMIVSVVSIFIHVVVSYTLLHLLSVYGLGHVGPTLATSTVALVNFFALALMMRKRIQRLEGKAILVSFIKIVTASLVMGIVAYLSYRGLEALLGTSGLLVRIIEALFPVGVGATVFFVMAKMLGVKELEQAIEAFARKLRRN
jgi:putative peptidoglycan lipid II flippase